MFIQRPFSLSIPLAIHFLHIPSSCHRDNDGNRHCRQIKSENISQNNRITLTHVEQPGLFSSYPRIVGDWHPRAGVHLGHFARNEGGFV